MRIPEHSLMGSSVAVPSASSSSQPCTVGRTLSDVAQRAVLLSKIDLQKDIEARQKQRTSLTLAQQERSEEPQAHRLFIVSARLPFTVVWNEDLGTFDVSRDPFTANIVDLLASAPPPSARSGPVAGGVRPPADRKLVGQPRVLRKSDGNPVVVTEELRPQLEDFLRSELDVVPVFLPPNRDRFADRMVWPLFHYSLPSAETGLGLYDWEGYELVNQTFRDAIMNEYRRGDLVWINDYPLMLLPKLLRLEMPDIPIGFYLHCVFPSSEVYRILPQREEILRGVLSSNIVGFHTFEYAQQFLNSCIHILGLECSASCIEACEDAGGTTTKVVTVPLGIDIEPYQEVLNTSAARDRMLQLQQTFETKKLLVALDRLEEKKGIPHKIMAFHKFLQTHPEWAEKCVLVQIVESFTSEESVGEDAEGEHSGEQQRLLQQVYQMVGEVNSKFGTIGHLPVHFLCQDFNKTELVALFAKAHVMFDTPLRDVLSQSAHEFLCCQEEKQCGVLILSEFSGSAQSLRAASLTVNPWDTNAFADAIQEALEMDMHDRAELHRYGRKYVQEYTLRNWATNFLDELQTAERECETERLQIPPQLDHDKPVAAMRKVNRRLIILGFSGTLVPHKSRLITKILPKLQPVLLGNLQVIAEDPNTHLVIISGLSRDTLSVTLASVNCWIIGEGGICYREPTSVTWHESVEQRDTEWLAPVKEIMEYFTARTPGSNVIEMNSSVSWLYQNTQGDHAAIQSKDLLVHLWAGPLLSAPAEVVVEKDSVTVRPTGTGKAAQLEKLLHQICSEESPEAPNRWLMGDTLVVCIGDFLMRDEDIFATVKSYFEPEGGGDAYDADEQASLWTEGQPMLPDHREPLRGEAMNLEANSMSLGTGFNFAATSRLDDSPFGILKGDCAFEAAPGIPKKTPSEPDLQVGESDPHADRLLEAEAQAEAMRGGPALFTCTVNRKATRASYHLSDTNDVAFLIAQLAREIKQAKQGLLPRDSPETSAVAEPRATGREARKTACGTAGDSGRGPAGRGDLRIPALPSRATVSGYAGLSSLFETI